LAVGLCKFYANAGEKTNNTAPTTISATQASSQSTFINPQHVIRRNDKNKQLALLPMQKVIMKSSEPLKNLKTSRIP
jgi:hypothetical protein